jgi:hypothetical protein
MNRCSVVRDGDTLYIQIVVGESTVIHDRIQINHGDLIHEDSELQIVGCTSYATAHEYKPGMLRRRLDAVASVLAR